MRADEGRQLRIDFEGQPGMAGAEPRELPEAPTHARGTEEDELDAMQVGNTEDLLERICSRENMQAACDRVVRNGGAGGVDGMGVAELPAWLDVERRIVPMNDDRMRQFDLCRLPPVTEAK